jgi:hypothetical protein
MIFAIGHNSFRSCALLGATLLVGMGVALLPGCKGNTRAANVDRTGQTPMVMARAIPASRIGLADPLTSEVWKAADWWTLAAPANTPRTTPTSRTAVLFDAGTLFVAVVNELPEAGRAATEDVVSVYVDTAGKGKEVLQVTADAQGMTRCAWIRSSVPVGPKEDGSPNTGYPLDIRPDFKVTGLATYPGHGVVDGHAVWTIVVAVPVTGMPPLMQALPGSEAPWKFNVLRTMTRGGEQYQANLSPVYVNAQAVSAYRMAGLAFGQQAEP